MAVAELSPEPKFAYCEFNDYANRDLTENGIYIYSFGYGCYWNEFKLNTTSHPKHGYIKIYLISKINVV